MKVSKPFAIQPYPELVNESDKAAATIPEVSRHLLHSLALRLGLQQLNGLPAEELRTLAAAHMQRRRSERKPNATWRGRCLHRGQAGRCALCGADLEVATK